MAEAAERTAVVLFNLGGPDRPAAVAPFLVNLFSDRAIIALPQPLRFLLARLIARRRAPVARAIYDQIGGGSPLLANTQDQARALEAALAGGPGETRCFIAMRYWHPLAGAAAAAVKDWGATRILLLPLYPQFSSTSTASSLADWRRAARAVGLSAPTQAICCYPAAAGWIEALADGIRAVLPQARAAGAPPRLLFSAHGLPQRIVERGDPYQWQVERSAAAVAERLAASGEPVEWLVCYQSRVGPLQWLTPSTDAEIARAGAEKRPLVICPIAFVSEHSETLVELDIEYRHLAERAGVPAYIRVPTVGTAPAFVAALAELVRAALASGAPLRAGEGRRICPASFTLCPQDGRA
jgi:ferrochelatase